MLGKEDGVNDIFIKEIQATAGFFVKDGAVLLAEKQGKIGKGFLMPYGGKIEDESPAECMMREATEESGVVCTDIEYVGILYCKNHKGTARYNMCIYLYLIHGWVGEFQDTPEMKNPWWFRNNRLPCGKMLGADERFLPPLLAGKNVIAHARYDVSTMHLESFEMLIVERVPKLQRR
jgi:8-oxo-dGTP pyrophosphatase MutT (NUDIX family)